MKSSTRIRLILGLASGAMVAILAVPSKNKSVATEPAPAVAPALQVTPGASTPTASHAARLAEQRERSAELAWGRDPFASPEGSSTQPQAVSQTEGLPRLTGLSVLRGERMAIIDREVVHEGDRLSSGYTVLSITPSTVTLQLRDEQLTLILGAKQ